MKRKEGKEKKRQGTGWNEMAREMKCKDSPQGRENLKVTGRKEKVVDGKGQGKKARERKRSK